MLVEELMTREVICLGPGDRVIDALRIAREKRIRHLPVTEGRRLVGIISDRDLRDVAPSTLVPGAPMDILENTLVGQIMHREVITAHPLDPVGEAARLLYEHRIGCLPVVKGEELVGIVTETDILRCLVELMGVVRPGSHLEVEVPDRPGGLATVASIIKEHGVNVISVLTVPAGRPGHRVLVFRLETIDLRNIAREVAAAGYRVVWPVREW